MIVTPEGLNVFPEDVERVVAHQPGVRDVAVVGSRTVAEERVHAVVILDPGTDPQTVVREANIALADHQKIRGISLWPSGELPRTEGTRKLKRREIHDWVATGAVPQRSTADATSVADLVAQFTGGREVKPGTTLDELGLSSLERVELMVAIEEKFGTTVDEAAFASAPNVAALEKIVQQPPVTTDEPADTVDFPRWNRGWPARTLRRVSLPTWILPLARAFAWIKVDGLEHLKDLEGPVMFASNHQSHMDTPAILWALPPKWRYRVTVAMAKEFFKAHFFPEQFGRRAWFTNSLNYYLAALFFNAFPLPQREAGARQTLRYIGDLLTDGWSVLIFPEGRRSDDGSVTEFRPGIGMIGSRLDVPVIPVRLEGLDQVLHHSARMATPGPARVAFGAPLRLQGEDYAALAKSVEEAVRELGSTQARVPERRNR
jgi:long-chain acyl-CoA synthetase